MDIDAFDNSMDVDVAGAASRAHGYGTHLPTGSAYRDGRYGHDHGHSHGDMRGNASGLDLHDRHHSHGQDVGGSARNGGSESLHGTIQPFARPNQGVVTRLMMELRSLVSEQHAKRVVALGIIGGSFIPLLLLWCQSTNSMALIAFTFILFFDVLSLGVSLITIWVTKQRPSSVYTYGYERCEVLAVFSTTMLATFGAIFIMKESTERMVQPPEIHTGRLMLGAIVGLFTHLVLIYGSRNRAFSHVSSASKSSWLQEHFADICRSFCTVVPGLDHFLLPRVNPFVLVGLGGMLSICVTDFLVDMNNFHMADPVAAFCIAAMIIGTMAPMSVYTGTILLQTTPAHILGQLDKCLREASTLDGVLEFRNEHFWTLSFGQLTGSLNVRVRRDADEQLVLAHVFHKLSHLVPTLTVQIIKDEWTRINPVSAAIGSRKTLRDDFTPGPATPKSQFKNPNPVSSLPNYLASNNLYGSPGSQNLYGSSASNHPYGSSTSRVAMTPARAHSTPFGTPMKDVSFVSDMDSVPSNDVPSPIVPNPRIKSILRTNPTNSAHGAGRLGGQYPSADFAPPRNVPSTSSSGSAVIDFSTLGASSAFSTNNMMSAGARTNMKR